MHKSKIDQILKMKSISLHSSNEFELNSFRIRIFHRESDPENANRIRVKSKHMEVEFLPSKGLSISQAWIFDRSIFWDPPIDLVDTGELDLWSDEIRINGEPSQGFTFLKTLYGGLEFYGLTNWGMPTIKNGKLEILHGETSNIPVEEIQYGSDNNKHCWIMVSFIYRSFEGDSKLPWYDRGEALYRVSRKYTMAADSLEIIVEDEIENVSSAALLPDWGYHLTLRPEDGARLLVPSKLVQERGGGDLPEDIETWHEADKPSVRTETGIIHQKLQTTHAGTVVSLLNYPDGTGLALSVPPSRYFQTWFCNGGKGSKEFTDRKGNSILLGNWDGMGLEIGSSALDHNENTDESVSPEPELAPGESRTIILKIQYLDKQKTEDLAERINTYKSR